MFGKLLQKVSLLGDDIADKTNEAAKNIGDGVSNIGKKAVELKNEISSSSASVEPSDILNVKTALEKVGSYEKPEWGMTDFTDNQMFDGIKKFQKDNGLKVDGIMKPDGETVSKLNEVIAQNNDFDWSKFPNKERIPEYQDKVIKEKYDSENNSFSKVYKKTMDEFTRRNVNNDTVMGDFSRNYRELVANNVPDSDKYYHAKANFEASKRGRKGYLKSRVIGDTREVIDYLGKDIWKDGPIKALKNVVEDRKANQLGRDLSFKYPNDSFENAFLKYNREKYKK